MAAPTGGALRVFRGAGIYDGWGIHDAQPYLTLNITGELYVQLKGKKCVPLSSDMKLNIRVADEQWFYYPDAMVCCDPAGLKELYCDAPAVIFEVLSPSTEMTDRREKRLAYERLPSLHTYVIVAQEKREVTVYRRGGGEWQKTILPEAGDALVIEELEFSLPLDALYARTGL